LIFSTFSVVIWFSNAAKTKISHSSSKISSFEIIFAPGSSVTDCLFAFSFSIFSIFSQSGSNTHHFESEIAIIFAPFSAINFAKFNQALPAH
jgi:hypothetical protein